MKFASRSAIDVTKHKVGHNRYRHDFFLFLSLSLFSFNSNGEHYTRGCALSIRKSRSRSSCFSRSPPPLEISRYEILFFSLCLLPLLFSSLSLSLCLSASPRPVRGARVELHEARPCVLADNTHVELRTLALDDDDDDDDDDDAAASYLFIIFFPRETLSL